MESKINEILNSTNKKQFLIDVLDKVVKESDFYVAVVEKSESLVKEYADNYTETCAQLSEYVYENMPENARVVFEKEITKFIDEEVHPRM